MVESVLVVLGAANVNSGSRVGIYINDITWLDYGSELYPDFVLFRLSSKVSFTSLIQPIRMPAIYQESWTLESWSVIVAGYSAGTVLNYGYFYILTSNECNFRPSEICSVGEFNVATSAEGGDSGKAYEF